MENVQTTWRKLKLVSEGPNTIKYTHMKAYDIINRITAELKSDNVQ